LNFVWPSIRGSRVVREATEFDGTEAFRQLGLGDQGKEQVPVVLDVEGADDADPWRTTQADPPDVSVSVRQRALSASTNSPVPLTGESCSDHDGHQ
jgi:hypothetical protein